MSQEITTQRKNKTYIDYVLDDYPLDPFEYRVFCRLSRREGKEGKARESVANMGRIGISASKIRQCLRVLEALGMVKGKEVPGKPTHYQTVETVSKWAKPSQYEKIKQATLAPKSKRNQPRDIARRQAAAAQSTDEEKDQPPQQEVLATPTGGVAPPQQEVLATPTGGVAKGVPREGLQEEGCLKDTKSTTSVTVESARSEVSEILKTNFGNKYQNWIDHNPQRKKWFDIPLDQLRTIVNKAHQTHQGNLQTHLADLLDISCDIKKITTQQNQTFSAAPPQQSSAPVGFLEFSDAKFRDMIKSKDYSKSAIEFMRKQRIKHRQAQAEDSSEQERRLEKAAKLRKDALYAQAAMWGKNGGGLREASA